MGKDLRKQSFETLAIHAGQEPERTTGAVTVPIFQTSTCAQEAVGKDKGFDYARTNNPTRKALETCLAALESGSWGLAFASGMAGEDAIAHLLLRDGFLSAQTLKQAHHVTTTGKRAMPTFQVEASSTALPSRGQFAAIFDVTTPTRSKPRVKFGALAPAIATRQAAGQPIPVLGIAGNLLGHADPSTLEETCGGVFFKGRLNLESAEAIDMLRSLKANSVQVEYSEDLRELTLHRAFKTEPEKRPAWSGDATRAAMELEGVLLPKPDGTVTHREQLQVEVDAGLQDADELKRYDEIAQQTRDQMHRIMATPLADAYIERERTRQVA